MTNTTPPSPPSPRFTLELEFVLSLSNPYYLSHLAQNYPHLLNTPQSTKKAPAPQDSDASCFARYLAYLYAYWRTPQYAKYLTHPGAVLGTLELLQRERFRREVIRPDLIARLLERPAEGEENVVGGGAEGAEGAEGGDVGPAGEMETAGD